MFACSRAHGSTHTYLCVLQALAGQMSVPAPAPVALAVGEAQWVQCDVRTFDLSLLGKFGVIMADPPWDIHMQLPYGTMRDDEMRQLKVCLTHSLAHPHAWLVCDGACSRRCPLWLRRVCCSCG